MYDTMGCKADFLFWLVASLWHETSSIVQQCKNLVKIASLVIQVDSALDFKASVRHCVSHDLGGATFQRDMRVDC